MLVGQPLSRELFGELRDPAQQNGYLTGSYPLMQLARSYLLPTETFTQALFEGFANNAGYRNIYIRNEQDMNPNGIAFDVGRYLLNTYFGTNLARRNLELFKRVGK